MTGRDLKRFLAKVALDDGGRCWEWKAHWGAEGYGRFWLTDRARMAHRVSYEHFVGPIPKGLTLDHTCHGADNSCSGGPECRHRRCVNPAHLEAVTLLENVRRGVPAQKTHCPQGHPYSAFNTYVSLDALGRKGRTCRTCAISSARRSKERRRLLASD